MADNNTPLAASSLVYLTKPHVHDTPSSTTNNNNNTNKSPIKGTAYNNSKVKQMISLA